MWGQGEGILALKLSHDTSREFCRPLHPTGPDGRACLAWLDGFSCPRPHKQCV